MNYFFDKNRFNKFKNTNYDVILGWDKKKNTSNFDIIEKKKINYKITSNGFRKSKYFKYKNSIITFGDSYVFARQVENENTWQEFLSKYTKKFISNYGVGNYGLDQAYLKSKKVRLKKNTKIVIFGFVPETICRIQSIWKNFLEFGNLHGFKPYCKISNNKIKIFNNYLKKNTKITDLNKIIKKIEKEDRFFSEKFEKKIFKFPYLFSFFKDFDQNINLIKNTFFLSFKKNLTPKKINQIIFPYIMADNIKNSHKLYKEKYSAFLMENLIKTINTEFILKKKKVYFVIFPQLMDLKIETRKYYQEFYKNLKNHANIIDLTNDFKSLNYKKFFINDKYGGHLNIKGNKFVANVLKNKIKI